MIKFFGMDVDGTLTDGSVYQLCTGEEMLKFSRRDGHGIYLIKELGIETFVISGEKNTIIEQRCKKMNIDNIYLGIKDKYNFMLEVLKAKNLKWNEVAYIGDDVNDHMLLSVVGISATPQNGVKENLRIANYVCDLNGGEGCVREFAYKILEGEFRKNELELHFSSKKQTPKPALCNSGVGANSRLLG